MQSLIKNKMSLSSWCLCLVFAISSISSQEAADFLSDEFIDFINSNQTLWRAGRNFRRDLSFKYIQHLAATLADNSTNDGGFDEPPQINEDVALPDNFDARVRWANCPVIGDIRDQGSCGSCWAVAAVAVMTDRICIASKGNVNFYFSADDVLGCCQDCGQGCLGGLLKKSWAFCKREGIVSGGNYLSHEGCIPYSFPPCDHSPTNKLEPCIESQLTPACRSVCEENYAYNYKSDKKRCEKIYVVPDVNSAMKEIYHRGPVTVSFSVYADFLNYKSGIYRHVTGKYIGGHSVKLIGWGVDNGVKYWLAANTWNAEWGAKGFFKIVRGENHCGIENVFATGQF